MAPKVESEDIQRRGPSGAEGRVRTFGSSRLNPDKAEITGRHFQLQTAVAADVKSISIFPSDGHTLWSDTLTLSRRHLTELHLDS